MQTIFLTAILAPADEMEFLKRARIAGGQWQIFRLQTIRKNIRYRAEVVSVRKADMQEAEEDEKVYGVI